MDTLLLRFSSWLEHQGFTASSAESFARLVAIAGMVILAIAANWMAKQVILRAVSAVVQRTRAKWDDILLETGVFTRLSHLAPAIVIDVLGPLVLGESHSGFSLLENATTLYLILICLLVLSALLKAVERIVGQTPQGARIPVKGFTQAIMLVASLVAGVFALATVMGKSPV